MLTFLAEGEEIDFRLAKVLIIFYLCLLSELSFAQFKQLLLILLIKLLAVVHVDLVQCPS